MYIVEEMRTNKFVDCRIPAPKKLFEQYGYSHRNVRGDVREDGAFAEPCNLGDSDNRVDSLARAGASLFGAMQDARIAAQMSAKAAEAPVSPPEPTTPSSSGTNVEA